MRKDDAKAAGISESSREDLGWQTSKWGGEGFSDHGVIGGQFDHNGVDTEITLEIGTGGD